MYVKIFAQIYDSSIADSYLVRFVFEDFLILADKDGHVDMTAAAIARRTNVPLKVVNMAIEKLSSPDLESRSPNEDGRRIVLLDPYRSWGWRIVNYAHYRNIRDNEARQEYFRDRKREQRSKSKGVLDGQEHVLDSQGQFTNVTEAEAISNKQKTPTPKAPPSSFVVPDWILPRTWKDFEEHRKKLRKPMTDRARDEILAELVKLRERGYDPETILAQSIRKGWQDVFELKGDFQAYAPAEKKSPLAGMKFANGGVQ